MFQILKDVYFRADVSQSIVIFLKDLDCHLYMWQVSITSPNAPQLRDDKILKSFSRMSSSQELAMMFSSISTTVFCEKFQGHTRFFKIQLVGKVHEK